MHRRQKSGAVSSSRTKPKERPTHTAAGSASTQRTAERRRSLGVCQQSECTHEPGRRQTAPAAAKTGWDRALHAHSRNCWGSGLATSIAPKYSPQPDAKACRGAERLLTANRRGNKNKSDLCARRREAFPSDPLPSIRSSALRPEAHTSVCQGAAAHAPAPLRQWAGQSVPAGETPRGWRGEKGEARACVTMKTKGWAGQVHGVLSEHVLQDKSFWHLPSVPQKCFWLSSFLEWILKPLFLI